MGRTDLAVAVRADQQQRLDLAVGQQRLQQVERRTVGPLQVIQKDDERMLPPGQDPKKILDDRRKRFCVSVAPSAGAGGCGPRRRSELGDYLGEHARAMAQTLGRAGSRQAATCSSSSVRSCWTSSRKAWSSAPYGTLATWSNFPAMKRPCRPTERPVELPDQGRLSDPGITGDQQELTRPCPDPLERFQQLRELPLASVEALGKQEAIADVAPARRRRAQVAVLLPTPSSTGKGRPRARRRSGIALRPPSPGAS